MPATPRAANERNAAQGQQRMCALTITVEPTSEYSTDGFTPAARHATVHPLPDPFTPPASPSKDTFVGSGSPSWVRRAWGVCRYVDMPQPRRRMVWSWVMTAVGLVSHTEWLRTLNLVVVCLKLVCLAVLYPQVNNVENNVVVFCMGWHVCCLVAVTILPRLHADPCKLARINPMWVVMAGVCNMLYFTAYGCYYVMYQLSWVSGFGFSGTSPVEGRVGVALIFFPFTPASVFGLAWGCISIASRLPLTMAWHVCFVVLYEHLKRHTRGFRAMDKHTTVHDAYEEYLRLVESVIKACEGPHEPLMVFALLGPLLCIVLALKCALLTDLASTDGFLMTYVVLMLISILTSASLLSNVVIELSKCQKSMERALLAAQTGSGGIVGIGETLQKSQLLRYKQDVMLRPLGIYVVKGTVVVNSSSFVKVLSFLISVFFLLLNQKANMEKAAG